MRCWTSSSVTVRVTVTGVAVSEQEKVVCDAEKTRFACSDVSSELPPSMSASLIVTDPLASRVRVMSCVTTVGSVVSAALAWCGKEQVVSSTAARHRKVAENIPCTAETTPYVTEHGPAPMH